MWLLQPKKKEKNQLQMEILQNQLQYGKELGIKEKNPQPYKSIPNSLMHSRL